MAYTPPAGSAANFAFSGTSYTKPSGSSANFSFVVGATAVGAATLADLVVAGDATHSAPSFDTVTAVGVATLGGLIAAGVAAHGVAAVGSVSIGGLIASGIAAHGVAGAGAVPLGGLVASGVALHPRYSLKGEVRNTGVLVNRTVRAYRRDTGALVGEQITSVGRFDIHAGFSEAEHYIMPIDLGELADDYAPPVANRVLSVLAVD